MRLLLICSVILVGSPCLWAGDLSSTASSNPSGERVRTKNSFSVGVMGMSIHGFDEEPIYTQNMPHRLDDKARFVPSREVLAVYTRENQDQFLMSIGEDCYAQPAAFFGWGMHWQPWRYLDYGFVVGAYYRKGKYLSYKGETRNMKEFYTIDVGNNNQFVPLPMATLGLNLPIDQQTAFGLNIGTNYYLTHVIAVMKFGLSGKTKI